MNLSLVRKQFAKCGIFSELLDEDGKHIAFALEHAYPAQTRDGWIPKIPNGTFICFRGMHQLAGMSTPFETFEVTDVPNHTGILFHVGNFNKDSEGCILLGDGFQQNGNTVIMVTKSQVAFENFMHQQSLVNSFMLTVKTQDGVSLP